MEREIGSQIFQIIDEIEDYISNCKGKFMSSTEIIVNRDTMEEYLRELRRKAPDEINQCRKIIKNQEAIIGDAKTKAQNLLDQTIAHTDELLSQNEIMKRAYEQADEIVRMANEQAQAIVDTATLEANDVKAGASAYMEDVMVYLENIFDSSTKAVTDDYRALINTIDMYANKVREDHKQLHPELIEEVNEALPVDQVQ